MIPRENLSTGFPFEALPQDVIEVAELTNGMVSALPRTRIPNGAFLLAKNARVESDGIRRRDGTSQYVAKFDSNPIILLVGTVNGQGNARLIRVTPSGVQYSLAGSSFVAYTNGSGVSWTGIELRPSATTFLNDIYLGGFQYLLRLEDATKTVQKVDEGPNGAKFLTTFAERVIAANIGGATSLIAWSANGDPTDWTSISAGEENLILAPSDTGDAITGLFSMEGALVILRRSSIWTATRQPFAAQPFRFDAAHSGLGCDLPHSAVRVPGGIIFADYRTRGVYFYQLGGIPQRISQPIDDQLFTGLEEPEWIQGSFDWRTLTYKLGIAGSAKTFTRIWNFNMLNGPSWTYDDGPASRSMGTHIIDETGVFIDSLSGDIDDLIGSIDSLSSVGFDFTPLYGRADGEVLKEDAEADTDYGGTAFELEVVSPNFGSVSRRRTIIDLMLTVSYERAGSVTLEHSTDNSTWRNTKTITLSGDRVAMKKTSTTGNDLYWRLKASSSDVRIKAWWLRFGEKGLQR